MNLDLDLLRVLVYLYEECSVTGAARRLGKSQPSISVALRKLRQTFKDELFVKAARGIEPTPPRAGFRPPCSRSHLSANSKSWRA